MSRKSIAIFLIYSAIVPLLMLAAERNLPTRAAMMAAFLAGSLACYIATIRWQIDQGLR